MSYTMNELIIPIVTSIVGLIIGYIIRFYTERKLNHDMKYDELVLNDSINNIKDKLDIYWTIYFKLLICQSAKAQMEKLKDSTKFDTMLELENENIIKNLENIIHLITQNVQKMDIDDILMDQILRFITHVLAYKCLRQSNMQKKMPSDFGFPFPEDFATEITNRTMKYQQKYNEYLGIKNEKIE